MALGQYPGLAGAVARAGHDRVVDRSAAAGWTPGKTWQQRARNRRALVPDVGAAEKIAEAREFLLSSLQTGLENATGGDLEWIAYRRLLGGLQPVLPQQALHGALWQPISLNCPISM